MAVFPLGEAWPEGIEDHHSCTTSRLQIHESWRLVWLQWGQIFFSHPAETKTSKIIEGSIRNRKKVLIAQQKTKYLQDTNDEKT